MISLRDRPRSFILSGETQLDVTRLVHLVGRSAKFAEYGEAALFCVSPLDDSLAHPGELDVDVLPVSIRVKLEVLN